METTNLRFTGTKQPVVRGMKPQKLSLAPWCIQQFTAAGPTDVSVDRYARQRLWQIVEQLIRQEQLV